MLYPKPGDLLATKRKSTLDVYRELDWPDEAVVVVTLLSGHTPCLICGRASYRLNAAMCSDHLNAWDKLKTRYQAYRAGRAPNWACIAAKRVWTEDYDLL